MKFYGATSAHGNYFSLSFRACRKWAKGMARKGAVTVVGRIDLDRPSKKMVIDALNGGAKGAMDAMEEWWPSERGRQQTRMFPLLTEQLVAKRRNLKGRK